MTDPKVYPISHDLEADLTSFAVDQPEVAGAEYDVLVASALEYAGEIEHDPSLSPQSPQDVADILADWVRYHALTRIADLDVER